jgi:hypothetical protein
MTRPHNLRYLDMTLRLQQVLQYRQQNYRRMLPLQVTTLRNRQPAG